MENKNQPHIEKHHHHILPDSVSLGIGGALLVLTIITVAVAHVDLGRLNFVVAMLVASFKASLVALFFMNLKYDRKENGVIFVTSFLFLAIFVVLTSTDLFFRGDVAVKGPIAIAATGGSKLSKPWVATPELVARGRELYAQQCVSCHGAVGKGDGPAASALKPAPRDFTVEPGWKNGRRVTMVFKTLKEGLPGSAMAAYATLPADDRWALSHFVMSLGGKGEADTAADFAKIGVDPTKEGGGEAKEAATISIELAMSRMAEKEGEMHVAERMAAPASVGGRLYVARCQECHGSRGEGGVKVSNMGVRPKSFVTTGAITGVSVENFRKVVAQGVPGQLMPGFADLGASEVQELYQFVRSLPGGR